MENKEIIEGNKAIEIFVGNEVIKNTVIHKSGQRTHISESNYHKDWNMLIGVVEKIEKTGCIVEISYSLFCLCRICVIGKNGEKTFNIINDNNGDLEPITAVYKSVVQFITYYNSNK